MDLAACIEPDGGMPGPDLESRAASTAAALLALLAEGHTLKSGAFRRHVRRLADFLAAAPVPPGLVPPVAAVLDAVAADRAVPGNWLPHAIDPARFWSELRRALP
jgi:hypothetical protein